MLSNGYFADKYGGATSNANWWSVNLPSNERKIPDSHEVLMTKTSWKQVCFPVGCVPTVFLLGRLSILEKNGRPPCENGKPPLKEGDTPMWKWETSPEKIRDLPRQTPVKTLPSTILRMRPVTICFVDSHQTKIPFKDYVLKVWTYREKLFVGTMPKCRILSDQKDVTQTYLVLSVLFEVKETCELTTLALPLCLKRAKTTCDFQNLFPGVCLYWKCLKYSWYVLLKLLIIHVFLPLLLLGFQELKAIGIYCLIDVNKNDQSHLPIFTKQTYHEIEDGRFFYILVHNDKNSSIRKYFFSLNR